MSDQPPHLRPAGGCAGSSAWFPGGTPDGHAGEGLTWRRPVGEDSTVLSVKAVQQSARLAEDAVTVPSAKASAARALGPPWMTGAQGAGRRRPRGAAQRGRSRKSSQVMWGSGVSWVGGVRGEVRVGIAAGGGRGPPGGAPARPAQQGGGDSRSHHAQGRG